MAKLAAVKDGENTLIMVGQQIKQEAQLLLGWPTHGIRDLKMTPKGHQGQR